MSKTPDRSGFEEAVANMFSNPKYNSTYLFYAHILGQCKVQFDETLQAPAGVNFTHDHYNLYINPIGVPQPVDMAKIATLPAKEQKAINAKLKYDENNDPYIQEGFNDFPLEERLGILKHEMLHILENHILRKQDREHQKFNRATDCAINQQIEPSHLPEWVIRPKNLIDTPVADNQTSEQYYDLIVDKEGNDDGDGDGEGSGNGQPGSGPGSDSGSGTGKSLDDHSKWDESVGDKDLQKDITKGMLDKAISQTQKSRGDLPGSLSNWLDMFSHKREVNWRNVLRRITGNKRVGSKKTIMRQDRRLPDFEWIKGRTKDRMFNLLVVSDVSGSVSDSALLHLWGEVRHICDITQSGIDLIQVDTQPTPPEKLEKNTKIIERKACGGTYLAPAIDMAKKHKIDFNAVVVTTDGYLSESDVEQFAVLKQKVIWLIEKDGVIMDSMTQNGMQAFKLKE